MKIYHISPDKSRIAWGAPIFSKSAATSFESVGVFAYKKSCTSHSKIVH